MTLIARHLVIMGKVQGVFYRNWTVQTARALGLVGWVRNRTDGSVEAWVEGLGPQVDEFIRLAHDGPSAAKVSHIETGDVVPKGMRSFQERATR
ncbi:acylphosphatase [Sphingobium vermicomposti]|uniref:acylphosphatase n=1 Tax=Sphingobium vermicomposti TaxID=529005 RepID=A0A846M3T3_9SPHN|nr:acylphosphatase [Sphingobium vermicomposti]NIJ16572.1 acylphosphatase [Sphingobium vermicomposti]